MGGRAVFLSPAFQEQNLKILNSSLHKTEIILNSKIVFQPALIITDLLRLEVIWSNLPARKGPDRACCTEPCPDTPLITSRDADSRDSTFPVPFQGKGVSSLTVHTEKPSALTAVCGWSTWHRMSLIPKVWNIASGQFGKHFFSLEFSLETHKSHQQEAEWIFKTGQHVGPAALNSLLTFAMLLLL